MNALASVRAQPVNPFTRSPAHSIRESLRTTAAVIVVPIVIRVSRVVTVRDTGVRCIIVPITAAKARANNPFTTLHLVEITISCRSFVLKNLRQISASFSIRYCKDVEKPKKPLRNDRSRNSVWTSPFMWPLLTSVNVRILVFILKNRCLKPSPDHFADLEGQLTKIIITRQTDILHIFGNPHHETQNIQF